LAKELARRPPLSSDYLVVEPSPDVTYAVSSIDAPVFGRGGRVEFTIGVLGAPLRANGVTIKDLACRLRDEASQLSEIPPL